MAPKAKRNPSNPPKAKAATPKTAATAKPKAASGATAKSATAKAATAKASAAPVAAPAADTAAAEEEAKRKEEEDAKAKAEAEEAAKKEAEEAAKKEAEEAAKKVAARAELERLAALGNGDVTIKYNMYAEKFQIKDHTLTAAVIDETYCLSDVMPGCFIHLGEQEFTYGQEHVYIKEEPRGTFHGLMAGETYWCYVQQDTEQEQRDQEAMRQRWAGQTVGGGIGDRGSEGEHCSCGDGAPCTDPMNCKDWDNRFANAIKAGGNPLLFVV